MNFQNDQYTLRLAQEKDNEGIAAVFASGQFPGAISVRYLRNPKPLQSFEADGDKAVIIIVTDNTVDKVIGVGGAVIRGEYVEGRKATCAYLTGLKILPEYQKKIRFIAKAYQFLHETIAECEYFYTTILDDNVAAIALLEKNHRSMPRYHFLGHYTTYCFAGGKRILPLEKNHLEGFDALIESEFRGRSFTPVSHEIAGFGKKTFYCVREKEEIIACCYVGDQRATKQYHMCAYGGVYKALSHLPTRIAGYPAFPRPDCDIDYGVVSYLYVKNNDPRLLKRFLRSVAFDAGHQLLIWGAFENNPLSGAIRGMKTIRYGSRLYRVTWNHEEEIRPIEGVIGGEAALL